MLHCTRTLEFIIEKKETDPMMLRELFKVTLLLIHGTETKVKGYQTNGRVYIA